MTKGSSIASPQAYKRQIKVIVVDANWRRSRKHECRLPSFSADSANPCNTPICNLLDNIAVQRLSADCDDLIQRFTSARVRILGHFLKWMRLRISRAPIE
jgi:hypothetical protein